MQRLGYRTCHSLKQWVSQCYLDHPKPLLYENQKDFRYRSLLHFCLDSPSRANPSPSPLDIRSHCTGESRLKEPQSRKEFRGIYTRAIKGNHNRITHYKIIKPPREELASGSTQTINCPSLGQYNTPVEAKIVRQVATFYYGKDEGHVALGDGSSFYIPAMNEQEKCLTGMDKAKWVTRKAKEVFKDLQKVELKQFRKAIEMDAYSGHGRDGGSDPSSSDISLVFISCF